MMADNPAADGFLDETHQTGEGLLSFSESGPVGHVGRLDLRALYPDQDEQEAFRCRLEKAKSADQMLQCIITLEGDTLTYQTETLVPNRRTGRIPLLLVLGNPATHSVKQGAFFAHEGKDREHRFWKGIRSSGLASLPEHFGDAIGGGPDAMTATLRNVSYESPFCLGLTVYYSFPSSASGRYWSGVGGLRRLFGSRALAVVEAAERKRLQRILQTFTSPQGAAIAFQKDAYTGLRSETSPAYGINSAWEGRLEGVCSLVPTVRLICTPPTRFAVGSRYAELLGRFGRAVQGQAERA